MLGVWLSVLIAFLILQLICTHEMSNKALFCFQNTGLLLDISNLTSDYFVVFRNLACVSEDEGFLQPCSEQRL